jgi:uncharacterized repeat protein (TIGR01451 family)/MYXO-CTERM domain-containing protein
MSVAKWSAAWAILCLSASAFAASSGAVSLSHHEALQRLSIQGQSNDGDQKLRAAGPVDLSFDALGRSFELQLSPNSTLLSAARNATAKGVIAYRGQLTGVSDSWARIVITDGKPSGLIWDGNELFAIEGPGSNVADADFTIIYRLADAVIAPGSMTCGVGDSFGNGAALYKTLVAELSAAQALGAVSEIDVGAVGDFDFFALHGVNSDTEILTRLNNVDGIFSAELGIQVNVPIVETFETDAADPFTDTVVAGDLLAELSTYRDGNAAQNANGLTHLWTGKDVVSDTGNNSTVGIAYIGSVGQPGNSLALCSRRFGAGLSEGLRDSTFDSLIAAHEIGHNFGAPHDGVAGSPCESETGDFLMATSINMSNQFSQCSKDEMADDIAQAAIAGCIAPLPTVDMRVSLNGSDPTILLGNTATVTFDFANAGTLQATNVNATITLPNNTSLVSAAASIGSCTDVGGAVDCVIGTVDGSSTASVTLTSDTTAVGFDTFDATVTADIDERSENNQDSALLTVNPAVNLVVNAPPARQINVNQSTTVSATLNNTSILDATGVTLSISLSAGLRADSASWSIGTCTVTTSQVDCVAASFDAQSSSTLSVGVTGTTEGGKNVSVSLASIEADADPSNNSANATVNVGTVEESGGGVAGLWLLSLLGLVAMRRRKSV